MEDKKKGECRCGPNAAKPSHRLADAWPWRPMPRFGGVHVTPEETLSSRGGVTHAHEVGPFNLPARLVERTVAEQAMPRAGAALSPAFNAVLAESARLAMHEAALSSFGANLFSQEQPPSPPAGASTDEDCAEWAKRMLKWLQENGRANDSPIVLKCGNDTYTFYLDPYSDDDLWVQSIETIDHEFDKAVLKGLGTPAPDIWSDPGPVPDIDEWWANPEAAEKKLPKDVDGKFIKKDITGQVDCLGMRIRRTDTLSAFYMHEFEFTKDYRIPDTAGRADQKAIKDAEAKLIELMERAVKEAGGYPAQIGSQSASKKAAVPSQSAVKSALESTIGIRLLANRALSCRTPCKLRWTIVGWENLKATALTAEELTRQIPQHSRPGVKVEVGTPTRAAGYWVVKIKVYGKAWVKLSGDVDYDVFCMDP